MGKWIKIDYEMDLLESGVSKEKLKFKANSTETDRQDRILNVAMNVNLYSNYAYSVPGKFSNIRV